MKRTPFFLFLFLIFSMSTLSQNKLDSIKTLLQLLSKKTGYTTDTTKFNTLLFTGNSLIYSQPDTALLYFKSAKVIAAKLKDDYLLAEVNRVIGRTYVQKLNLEQGLVFYSLALNLSKKNAQSVISATQAKYLKQQAIIINEIGVMHFDRGRYPKALENYFLALKINIQINSKDGQAINLNNIGTIYRNQKNYEKSVKFFLQALALNEKLGNKIFAATNINNIGNVYLTKGDLLKALEYYFKVLKIGNEINNKYTQSIATSNIGAAYLEQANYPKALEYSFKGIDLAEQIHNNNMKVIGYGNVASTYIKQKVYTKALYYTKKTLDLAIELESLPDIKLAHENYFTIYSETNCPQLALENYKKYIIFRDSISNVENNRTILQKEIQFNYDKKATADSIRANSEKKIAATKLLESQTKLKLEKTQKIYLYVIILISLMLATGQFYNYQQKAKSNKLLNEQKQQIEKKNTLLEKQSRLITDSLEYARTIQESMLPNKEILKRYFLDSFIYYQPKDIVSGDFYWLKETPSGLALAVADCTGHGVSGALMSVLGHNILDSAYQQLVNPLPSNVIYFADNYIRQKAKSYTNYTTDVVGMALSLIHFDAIEKKIIYSVVNQYIYLVRNSELIEMKGGSFSIGSLQSNEIILRELNLQKNDMLYLFTDGYADQKGEVEKRKLMYPSLKKIFIQISQLTCDEQSAQLKKELYNWKGNLTQVDDVLVVGLKI